jgi:hypothetical protein
MFQFGRLDVGRLFETELKNHAKNNFPQQDGKIPFFRSHQVGRAPWPVNRVEAMFLCDIMYVIFGMAMRLEDFREPIGSRAMEEVYTMPVDADGKLGEPSWVKLPEITNEIQADVNLPGELIQRVRDLPTGENPMEVDHVFLPYFPGRYPANTPPRTGYLFLLATPRDDQRADIAAFTLHADGDLTSVWPKLPGHVLDVIAAQGVRPPEIMVTDSRLMALLRPLTELLPLKLTRAENLPVIERECPDILKKMKLQPGV